MNPATWRHSVNVHRFSASIGGTLEKSRSLDEVHTGIRCAMEPLGGRARESALGRVPGADFSMSWGTEEIKIDDRIEWTDPATNKWFVVREVTEDSMGWAGYPSYSSAVLEAFRGGQL